MVITTGSRLTALFAALGFLGVAAACNGVLGIDSAALDPSFGQDAGPAASPACTSYCNTVIANCPGQEYNDVATCLALCPAFDLGQPTDTNQDSLECRTHYAQLAASDKSSCRAAGPLGGGVCGNNLCSTFCVLDTFACTGPNNEYDGGTTGCEGTCLASFDIYLTDAGNDLALSNGNSLNCRMWHLEAAVDPAVEGPKSLETHCPHTALVSAFCNNN